jgi:hypothetical protein
VVNWPGRPIAQAVQSRYFTAACNAVAREHLGGIYFWAIGIGQDLSVPPGAADLPRGMRTTAPGKSA